MPDSPSSDQGRRRVRGAHPRLGWILSSVALASVLLLIGMISGFEAWGMVFALAASAFGVLLMLLPRGRRLPRAGLAVVVGSMALGVLAVFGLLGTKDPGGRILQLAYMLGFFWILPLVVLSISHARRFEAEGKEDENSEEAS